MAMHLKQSTASQSVLIGPFLDDTDFVSEEVSLTISNTDIRLSKNGANLAAKNSGGGTHDESGWYQITLDATDTDTVGRLQLFVHESGALPVYHEYEVLEEAVYAAVYASAAALDVNDVNGDVIGSVQGTCPLVAATQTQIDDIQTAVETDIPADLNNIAVTGSAVNTVAESYALTSGTQTGGAYTDTAPLDGTVHEHDSAAGVMDLYYQFDVGGDGIPTGALVNASLVGNNDDLEVHAYNWGGAAFEQVGTILGTSGATFFAHTFSLLTSHVGTGANLGKVRIRFTDGAFTLTSATLQVDQIICSYSIANRSVGYEDGAVWIDTISGVAGTENFVNGTGDNPVLTLADALTLATSLGLHRFRIVNDSTLTLASGYTNWTFLGDDWILALGGQALNHCHFEGAAVTGVSSGSNTQFTNCDVGAATLTDGKYRECGFSGTVTFAGAGSYFFIDCYSEVAAATNPLFDHNSLLANGHYVNWTGGVEIQNLTQGDSSVDIDPGTVIFGATNSGGTLEVRGTGVLTDTSTGTTVTDDLGGTGIVSANLTQVDGVALVSHTAGYVPSEPTDANAITGSVVDANGTLTTAHTDLDTGTHTLTTNDVVVGRAVRWLTGALVGLIQPIEAYNGSTGVITFVEGPAAPANTDTFELI